MSYHNEPLQHENGWVCMKRWGEEYTEHVSRTDEAEFGHSAGGRSVGMIALRRVK